ncbi:HbrB-like-domain-containing protein [Gilbertella persicaria]|uniref:HbrB-like-domain-containing protein n=1 Tax=Gilbertella persicaria TaxID=101096 RepID=UPI00221E7349|nr:HbrB-like-domain-containing protein [Gilbertella persicaria]KAI8050164.1 HbrB-like-domain-containing protein [Gilbertella persicaria]
MPSPHTADETNNVPLSCSSNSSSSLSASIENNASPNPTRSLSATTLTIRSPPSGGGSQTKRHSERSNSTSQYTTRQTSTEKLPQRPSSPITSPSIHKSLTALDAKAITRDMEKSTMHLREDMMSPSSPTTAQSANNGNFYFGSNNPSTNNSTFQSMAAPSNTPSHYPYHRQNSVSSVITLPPTVHQNSTQADAWQTLCVRVLPLFNGEGVQGAIEDLNDLLRRCISDPISPQFYRDIEALLRDGMFTLNAKMFGVTDEKLLDRLVEQWSFFFTYALPYFEAVFLPLRTDVRYRSQDEAEMWNVRSMALRSFRDNVILLQTKRLEDVFNKLFTDFGSSQNPAATAAKMLQMTSLLASSPDHNEEIERVLSNLKANWKIMMTKGDRRGFAGVRKVRPLNI